MDITGEIKEIGQLIVSTALLHEIREQVSSVMKQGFVVTDGSHHPLGSGYDVVVKCGSDNHSNVSRRIRGTVKNVQVDRIADGVLGIKTARRVRN